MKFAQRMEELGTETAFEVLARARALEAQGTQIVHLEIGEPDFTTPAYIIEAARKALQRRLHPLYSRAWHPRTARGHRQRCDRAARDRIRAGRCGRDAGRQAGHVLLASSRCATQGDEVIYPNPASRSMNR